MKTQERQPAAEPNKTWRQQIEVEEGMTEGAGGHRVQRWSWRAWTPRQSRWQPRTTPSRWLSFMAVTSYWCTPSSHHLLGLVTKSKRCQKPGLAEKLLAAVAAQLVIPPQVQVSMKAEPADAVEVLEMYRTRPAMLVLGRDNVSWIERLFFGAVTSQVVDHIPAH